MQSDNADRPPQAPDGPAPRPSAWQRIVSWDREFSIAKGLAVVTLLTSVFGGYFQYLNAYQEKVSTQAKDDMTAATATFLEISNALAEMQSQQQLPYSGFTHAKDKSSASDSRSTPEMPRTFPMPTKRRGPRSANISTCWHERPRSISIGRAISAAMRPQSATSMTTR
jgi:hypothetical protein